MKTEGSWKEELVEYDNAAEALANVLGANIARDCLNPRPLNV